MKKLLLLLPLISCSVILKAQLDNQFISELGAMAEAMQLACSIQVGNMARVKELIGRNGPAVLNQTGSGTGYAALHWLVERKLVDEETIQLFVERGANINPVNDRGETPLFLAARGDFAGHGLSKEDHMRSVEILLDAGADPFINTSAGKTILDGVATSTVMRFSPNPALVDMLKTYRALFSEVKQSPSIKTLHKAVELGRWALVDQLLPKVHPDIEKIKELNQLARDSRNKNRKLSYKIINKTLMSLAIQNIKLQKYFPDLPQDIISTIAAKSFVRRNASAQGNQSRSTQLMPVPAQATKRKYLE